MVRFLAFTFAVAAIMLSFGCDNSTSSRDSSEQTCVEPENPYEEGSGHYAGFNWAEENGGACSGNSDSFNEGCEEYYSQEDEYEACVAKNK